MEIKLNIDKDVVDLLINIMNRKLKEDQRKSLQTEDDIDNPWKDMEAWNEIDVKENDIEQEEIYKFLMKIVFSNHYSFL